MHLTISRDERVLGAAVGISILLHGALLSMHFKFPDSQRWKSANQPLEVVLVNARTRERPSRPEVLAQSNLDRGGNVDQNRRAKTPLPVTAPPKPGKDLAEAKRRVRELEVQQQRLLAQARESAARVPAERPRPAPSEQPATQPSGRDMADLALAAMRL
ncbi:MAG: TonB family protein, partial [Burkholderiales bacterium]|nr:TonB family protein [Burkholderiales bacterium]